MMQTNLAISAPGFMGVNIEDSPITLEQGWAAIADNAVVDRSGRIGSRKGYSILTPDNTVLGGEKITNIHEANYADGTTKIFATGNNLILEVDISTYALTDVTPVAATITADDWHIATLNDDTFFFQEGHAPLVYDNSTTTWSLVSAHVNYSGTVPEGDICIAAMGRLWVASTTSDKSTVHWSDLLIGAAWDTGSAGSLNLQTQWPNGNDTITALAHHNSQLVIFGRDSFIVYGSNAVDGRLGNPVTDLYQADAEANLGCIGKHGLVSTGKDLLFVDDSGLRSFSRVVQERSLPIGDITKNVRTQFKNETKLNSSSRPIRLVYSPEESFVLCLLDGLPHTYCFDVRGMLQDGSYRTTMWTGLDWSTYMRKVDGTLLVGNGEGVCKYNGYTDNGEGYRFRYYMHPQVFGQPSNLKIPKEIDFTIAGGSGQSATAYWGYDYVDLYKSQVFNLDSTTPDFYGVDEYNITEPTDPTEYGSGSTIGRYVIPVSGSGTSFIIGLEVTIIGAKVSLQEINIQTKMGRMV